MLILTVVSLQPCQSLLMHLHAAAFYHGPCQARLSKALAQCDRPSIHDSPNHACGDSTEMASSYSEATSAAQQSYAHIGISADV